MDIKEKFKDILERDEKFRYQILGRLASDCKAFLDYGNGNTDRLWTKNAEEHIPLMKELYKTFDIKPEWLTEKDIEAYEEKMKGYILEKNKDYEVPFEIGEYTSEKMMELEGSPIYEELEEIQDTWFSSLEELLENKDDIICYSNCDCMEDVARYLVEEVEQFGKVSESLQPYIDYQYLGRDMEFAGNYLVTSHGVFEYNTEKTENSLLRKEKQTKEKNNINNIKIINNATGEIIPIENLRERYPLGKVLNIWGDKVNDHETQALVDKLNNSFFDTDPSTGEEAYLLTYDLKKWEILDAEKEKSLVKQKEKDCGIEL